MIEKREVLDKAADLNLSPDTVEKDYVLGWMLHGISKNSETKQWAFKGGTSLKNASSKLFRFSEDLDFTLTSNGQMSQEFLLDCFKEIAAEVHEEAGIEFFPDDFRFKIIDKGNGNFSSQGKIHYNGPLRRARGVATIKLDLTTDEILVLDTVNRPVFHPYSDERREIHANCYAFEEVVAEKIRALAQRIRPRDLYDVVHFFRNRNMIENPQLVCDVLQKKCDFKAIEFPTFAYIQNHEKLDELEPQWEHMLAHQLPALPPIESFWDDLEPFFDWLAGQLEVEEVVQSEVVKGEIFRLDVLGFQGSQQVFLEEFSLPQQNRVCITLTYNGKQRTVEPLSFRTAQTGNRLFYGFERDAGHVKAYIIQNIQAVDITNTPYVERYPVEISPTGTIAMPPIRRSSREAFTRSLQPAFKQARMTGYPQYAIQCPYCQKTFKRNSLFDTKLNPHKNQFGQNCHGTQGFIV